MVGDTFKRLYDIYAIKHTYIRNTHEPITPSQRVAYPPTPSPRGNHFLKLVFIIFFPFETVSSHMHEYPNHVSLVLLAKETKWIYAANWGYSSKVAFLGHDPLMRGGCTCSNPSGSPLKFPAETFLSAPQESLLSLYGMFGLIQLIPITYFAHSFIWMRNISWVLLWTKTLCWRPVENQVKPWLPWSLFPPFPSCPPLPFEQ